MYCLVVHDHENHVFGTGGRAVWVLTASCVIAHDFLSLSMSTQSSYDADIVELAYPLISMFQKAGGVHDSPPSMANPSSTALSINGLSANESSAMTLAALTSS